MTVAGQGCWIRRNVLIIWYCGFPGADASQNRDNWMSPSRLKLLAELEQFKNLYYVNRTETDIATLAGLGSGRSDPVR